MAKKKKNVKVECVESTRRGVFTPTEIMDMAKTLEEAAIQLRAESQRVEQLPLTGVKVDGKTKFDRGMVLVHEFTLNLEHAINKAKLANL